MHFFPFTCIYLHSLFNLLCFLLFAFCFLLFEAYASLVHIDACSDPTMHELICYTCRPGL